MKNIFYSIPNSRKKATYRFPTRAPCDHVASRQHDRIQQLHSLITKKLILQKKVLFYPIKIYLCPSKKWKDLADCNHGKKALKCILILNSTIHVLSYSLIYDL